MRLPFTKPDLPRPRRGPSPDARPVVALAWEGVGVAGRHRCQPLLERVTLHLYPGEVHALLAGPGGGKSTAIAVAAGCRALGGGRLCRAGRTFRPRNPAAAREAGVAVVWQRPPLLPEASIRENLLLGNEPGEHGEARLVEDLLALLPPTLPSPEVAVGSLPLAQQQWIAIGRAIARFPPVLLLDEPATWFTGAERRHLWELLRLFARHGMAILYATRHVPETLALARRYTLLRHGTVESFGLIEHLDRSATAHLETQSVRSSRTPALDEARRPLLTVHEAGLERPRQLVLREGSICGLAGLPGSGRRALLHVIAGLRHDPHWEIWKAKESVGLFDPGAGEQYLMAERPVYENLTLGRPWHHLGFFPPLEARMVALDWMARLRIRAGTPTRPLAELSTFNQRKIALGRLLQARRRILLLAEPEFGFQPEERLWLLGWLEGLARAGHSVLVSGVSDAELLAVCDTVAVLHHGRFCAIRSASRWTENELAVCARKGCS
ncbi:MAG TPA: ATP-binding cassette domain-containing protein [Chthoniobacteraceae bacterium]|nr:ATP-binding cassette domain-containing protein [Chthoniobacteraceae bacterium]